MIEGGHDLAFVGVTGKPFIFAVGADLKGVRHVANRIEALEIGQLGHSVFRRLGALKVPTFAFVNGAAMGGGLEIALHCTYRTVSGGATAISLPECFLGLIPGWGGAYLLPNLIGVDQAITVIVENPLNLNRQLKPKQVLELGIADVLLEPADFLAQSLAWAVQVVKGEVTVTRPEVDHSHEAWAAAVARGRALADAKLHGAAPAPYRALDLIVGGPQGHPRRGLRRRGRRARRPGDDRRAARGLYAFDLVQHRAKRPTGAPDKALARKVTKVGVVGAGPHGQPARAALPAAAAGPGRHDRPGPGPRRQGRGLRPRRDRQAAGQGPHRRRQGQPAQGAC